MTRPLARSFLLVILRRPDEKTKKSCIAMFIMRSTSSYVARDVMLRSKIRFYVLQSKKKIWRLTYSVCQLHVFGMSNIVVALSPKRRLGPSCYRCPCRLFSSSTEKTMRSILPGSWRDATNKRTPDKTKHRSTICLPLNPVPSLATLLMKCRR